MNNFGNRWKDTPSKGGIFGALAGIFIALRSHQPDEKDVKKAGRTALYAGAGFLAGSLFERFLQKFFKSKNQTNQ